MGSIVGPLGTAPTRFTFEPKLHCATWQRLKSLAPRLRTELTLSHVVPSQRFRPTSSSSQLSCSAQRLSSRRPRPTLRAQPPLPTQPRPPSMNSLPSALKRLIALQVEQLDQERNLRHASSLVNLSLVNRELADIGRSLCFRSIYLSSEEHDADCSYFASHIAPHHGVHVKELFCTFGVDSLDVEEPDLEEEEILEWSIKRRRVIARALPHLPELESLGLDVGDGDPPITAEDDPLVVAATLHLKSLRLLPLHLFADDHPQIDPDYLGRTLPLFAPTLTSLDITAVGNYGTEGNVAFVNALQALRHLRHLSLTDCDALGPPVTHVDFQCPLASLTLQRITRLDLLDLEEWLGAFKSTLTSLSLHHYTPMDEGSSAEFDLPMLKRLELESVWPISHLSAFRKCAGLESIRLGSAISPVRLRRHNLSHPNLLANLVSPRSQWRTAERQLGRSAWDFIWTEWEGLQSLTLLQGEECWGEGTVSWLQELCGDRDVAFGVEEGSSGSEEDSDEWSEELSM